MDLSSSCLRTRDKKTTGAAGLVMKLHSVVPTLVFCLFYISLQRPPVVYKRLVFLTFKERDFMMGTAEKQVLFHQIKTLYKKVIVLISELWE